jgi:hypothetical protein
LILTIVYCPSFRGSDVQGGVLSHHCREKKPKKVN